MLELEVGLGLGSSYGVDYLGCDCRLRVRVIPSLMDTVPCE